MGAEGDQAGALPKRADSVVLEMEALSSQVEVPNSDVTTSTKLNSNSSQLQRTLSRKAPNWWDKNSPKRESDESVKGGGRELSGGSTVTVGVDSTRCTESSGIRRCMSHGRRSSPWIHPRRVLLFFATLSSMGTIILIYFTLSVTKISGDDGNGFQS